MACNEDNCLKVGSIYARGTWGEGGNTSYTRPGESTPKIPFNRFHSLQNLERYSSETKQRRFTFQPGRLLSVALEEIQLRTEHRTKF